MVFEYCVSSHFIADFPSINVQKSKFQSITQQDALNLQQFLAQFNFLPLCLVIDLVLAMQILIVSLFRNEP